MLREKSMIKFLKTSLGLFDKILYELHEHCYKTLFINKIIVQSTCNIYQYAMHLLCAVDCILRRQVGSPS